MVCNHRASLCNEESATDTGRAGWGWVEITVYCEEHTTQKYLVLFVACCCVTAVASPSAGGYHPCFIIFFGHACFSVECYSNRSFSCIAHDTSAGLGRSSHPCLRMFFDYSFNVLMVLRAGIRVSVNPCEVPPPKDIWIIFVACYHTAIASPSRAVSTHVLEYFSDRHGSV